MQKTIYSEVHLCYYPRIAEKTAEPAQQYEPGKLGYVTLKG